jgi:hypothetical protein
VEQRYSSTLSLTSALGGGGWLTPPPAALTQVITQLTIVQDAGWGPRAGAKNLTYKGIRSPDRPVPVELSFKIKIYHKPYANFGGGGG